MIVKKKICSVYMGILLLGSVNISNAVNSVFDLADLNSSQNVNSPSNATSQFQFTTPVVSDPNKELGIDLKAYTSIDCSGFQDGFTAHSGNNLNPLSCNSAERANKTYTVSDSNLYGFISLTGAQPESIQCVEILDANNLATTTSAAVVCQPFPTSTCTLQHPLTLPLSDGRDCVPGN